MYNQTVVPDQLMNSTGLLTKVTGDDEVQGVLSHMRMKRFSMCLRRSWSTGRIPASSEASESNSRVIGQQAGKYNLLLLPKFLV